METWKEKNLDYEIETSLCPDSRDAIHPLEKKRTSITRLKPGNSRRYHRLIPETWKEKNLDYEIETIVRSPDIFLDHCTWKEKNLDYEIETMRVNRDMCL